MKAAVRLHNAFLHSDSTKSIRKQVAEIEAATSVLVSFYPTNSRFGVGKSKDITELLDRLQDAVGDLVERVEG